MNPSTRVANHPSAAARLSRCAGAIRTVPGTRAIAGALWIPLALLAGGTPLCAQCTLSFTAAVNYATPAGPSGMTVGDFNGDGRYDLATSCGQNNCMVAVLLGNGGGTFQPAATYTLPGQGYEGIASGDFNGDGRSDLAATIYLPDTVNIFMANPNGTLQPAATYGIPTNDPGWVAVGDFNADGNRDLAVSTAGNSVSIMLGNGNGTFQGPVAYSTGGRSRGVAVGDFNGDNRQDLAVANDQTNNVSILLGNGNGTFQPAVNYAAGTSPLRIAIGDFNHDGFRDLAVVDYAAISAVSILLGNGNGTFQPAVAYAVGSGSHTVAVADFNGDHNPDLVVDGGFSANISILLGNANGTFQPPVSFSAGGDTQCVVAADFNRDGRPDLAVSNGASTSISVFLNSTGGPVLTQQPLRTAAVAGQSAAFVVSALGNGPLTYQWRKDGMALMNEGSISGALTPALTINPALLADNGAAFDCLVTDACGATMSSPAGLVVSDCYANCDHSTTLPILNVNDFLCFQSRFVNGCP